MSPMFEKGQQADPSLAEGTFLAYLLPPSDGSDEYEFMPTQYGGAYKLYYNVFVPGARGTRRYVISELASPTYTTGGKLISRMGAASGLARVSDTHDLSALLLEGYLLVKLGYKEGSQYLDVMDASPLPRNYPIPSDIGDPAATQLDMQTQTVPAVDQIRRDEIEAPEAFDFGKVAPTDEPPF